LIIFFEKFFEHTLIFNEIIKIKNSKKIKN
jgi:hypothetical protein